jgi:acetyl esterase/lipase
MNARRAKAVMTQVCGLQPDASVGLGPCSVPFSVYASDEARHLLATGLSEGAGPAGASLLQLRAHYDRFNDRLLDRVRSHYPVEVVQSRIGGVGVLRVRPPVLRPGGPLLINLHGGAFAWGAGSGALVEAIPMACAIGAEVVTVDYRMAPEHRFPAASEDVAAVYTELLRQHAPHSVGIFGCSAGAVLTAQALAWFHSRGLPRPGAVAMLGGAGLEPRGDSAWLAPPLCGEALGGAPVDGVTQPLSLRDLPYLAEAGLEDPLVFPMRSIELLRDFPPTLLLSGSRDFAASGLSCFHRRLLSVGVDARLVLFDGLWHAFQIYPELPESTEAHALLAKFFRSNLSGHSGEKARP